LEAPVREVEQWLNSKGKDLYQLKTKLRIALDNLAQEKSVEEANHLVNALVERGAAKDPEVIQAKRRLMAHGLEQMRQRVRDESKRVRADLERVLRVCEYCFLSADPTTSAAYADLQRLVSRVQQLESKCDKYQ
jgi:hypothetical protein